MFNSTFANFTSFNSIRQGLDHFFYQCPSNPGKAPIFACQFQKYEIGNCSRSTTSHKQAPCAVYRFARYFLCATAT